MFRRKTMYKATKFLEYCNFYSQDIFEQLLNNFRSTWDCSRSLSFEILRYFPKDLPYLNDVYREKLINEQSRVLFQSPQLRDIEGGGFGIAFLLERKVDSNAKISYFEELVQE